MRTRLPKSERRDAILQEASQLFAAKGFANTEMEDIRRASNVSRGGLYHHFSSKADILDALVVREVTTLSKVLDQSQVAPIPALLMAGSTHLGQSPGIVACLRTDAEKRAYLSALEHAFASHLRGPLRDRLVEHVQDGINPDHVAELFLTVNAHINRREILGQWSRTDAAAFAATALAALAPLMKSQAALLSLSAELREKAAQP